MQKKARHRILDLLVRIVFLLSGTAAIGMDIATEIGAAQNQNPNNHVVTMFPIGTVVGIPLYWIGYRLVFRTPWLLFAYRLIVRLRLVNPPSPTPDAPSESN